jgi:hypothetical protein
MRSDFHSRLALRDKVVIDGDESVTGYVTGFLWRDVRGPVVEVSYFHGGAAIEKWIEEWRITRSTR